MKDKLRCAQIRAITEENLELGVMPFQEILRECFQAEMIRHETVIQRLIRKREHIKLNYNGKYERQCNYMFVCNSFLHQMM